MKLLGVLGGMSWESTALYDRLVNQGVAQRLGGLHSAPLLLQTNTMHRLACPVEAAGGLPLLHIADATGAALRAAAVDWLLPRRDDAPGQAAGLPHLPHLPGTR